MIKAQNTADNFMRNGRAQGRGDGLRRDVARALFVMDLVALATGVPAEQIRSATRGHSPKQV